MHSLAILSDKFPNFSPQHTPMGWGRGMTPDADTTKFSKFSLLSVGMSELPTSVKPETMTNPSTR